MPLFFFRLIILSAVFTFRGVGCRGVAVANKKSLNLGFVCLWISKTFFFVIRAAFAGSGVNVCGGGWLSMFAGVLFAVSACLFPAAGRQLCGRFWCVFYAGFPVRFWVLLLGGCCGLALVNTRLVAWSPFEF